MATIRQQLAEQAEQITELRQEVAELKAHLLAFRAAELGQISYPGPARRHLRPVPRRTTHRAN